MIPYCGPALFSVPGFQWAIVPTLGDLGPFTFRFPRNLFVTGLMALTGDGDSATLAKLFIRIQDETFQDVISDGQGQAFEAGLTALRGLSGKPFPVQRPVMSGDQWIITISSLDDAEGGIRLAGLYFFFDEPSDQRRAA